MKNSRRFFSLFSIVLAFLACSLLSAPARAVCTPGVHGVSIFQSCASPRNRCATDADCSDGDACTGVEQCATEESSGSNVIQCQVTLLNVAEHCDDVAVIDASDAILNGTGSPSSAQILVTGTNGTVSGAGCSVGTDLGGAQTCILSPSASISFGVDFYTLQPADPNPLHSQATVTLVDQCNSGGPGCSTATNTVQFTASMSTQSGCSPGTPIGTPGFHGVSIFQTCATVVNRCANDADCSDGDVCNGQEQCATEEFPGSNVMECIVRVENPSNHCDDLAVNELAHAVLNGTGSPNSSSAIPVTGTIGTVSGPGCDAGSDLGGAETCTLSPGSLIQFRVSYYVAQAGDPTPINGQATATVTDTCNNSASGCNTVPNTVQYTASSFTTNGCSASSITGCEPLPTGTGSNVPVSTSDGSVTATFENVSSPGTTTVAPIDPNSSGTLPPGGYEISGLNIGWEIVTDATISGAITLAFVVPSSVDQVTFNSLRILHREGDALVDRTYFSPPGCAPGPTPGSPCPAPNFATHTIYARVFSLSPFVIGALAVPSLQTITVPSNPVAVGTTVNAQATFTDPGTHTASWNWGDGSSSAGTVSEAGGFGNVSGSHVYSAAGIYLVTVTVTDEDGFSGQMVSPFVVVYDPNGGFATGGGWINSPEGAYAAESSLTGRANFGFISKYANKNATIPTGDTQFSFAAADFQFDSDSYEWMVISGAKARYRGVGKVNGSGSYGFELTAWDGQVNGSGPDRIRIKIWDRNHGNGIVYDNQMGAPDGADPTTALSGGSIVIHKK